MADAVHGADNGTSQNTATAASSSTSRPQNAGGSSLRLPSQLRHENVNLRGTSSAESIGKVVSARPTTTTTEPNMAHRKRNTRRDAAHGAENTSSADESAPIIRHQEGGPKDYQSISPALAARSSGAENGGDSEGALDQVERVRGHQLREEREAQRAAAEAERNEGKTWKKWLEKYGSVELENKGSVARDHLALERTFLAWLRTSLSFASIGIAITQLFRLNTTISNSNPTSNTRLRHVGKPLGATFIAISILVLFIGFHRYFEAQHYVIRGKFPASRGSVLVVTLVAGALIVSSLVVILVVAPKAFEK